MMSTHISSMRRVRMIPVFLGVILLAATLALKLGAGRSDAAVSPTMHAVVHQDASISLTFDDGSPVGNQARDIPTVPAGTYTVRVVDDASEHNIRLSGPGVDQSTSIGDEASPTWTVTIQAGGMYRFQCDSHLDFMFGLFQGSGAGGSSGGGTTGGGSSGGSSGGGSSSGGSSGGTTSNGGKTTSGTALRGTLAGTVAAGGKLKLLFNGKTVSKLKSGRYKVTVSDKTPARSFVLKQPGRSPITISGVGFVGTHTVTVTLKVGVWTFSTSAGTKSTSSFTVVA
jgi:hypothetical protein